MWKKYKVSVDKFINYSKDDYFQINMFPIVVREELISQLEMMDDSLLTSLYSIYYNKPLDMKEDERILSIEPKKIFYSIQELMILITFISKYEIYNYTNDKIKIKYALHWKNKVFLDAGCLVIDKDYPNIYNFYSTPVVEDILKYLYEN